MKHKALSFPWYGKMTDDKEPQSQTCPPVHAITIQKADEGSLTEATNAGSISDTTFHPANPTFDLMQVSITLYGVTGILCRTQNVKEKHMKDKKQRNPKSFPKEKKSKKVKETHQTDISKKEKKSPKVTDNHEINPSSTMSSDSVTAFGKKALPPLTAVVSYGKNIFSSGTTMETYVPSRPLDMLSRPEARTLEYAARWPGWEEGNELNTNDTHTFTVARVMRQQQYLTAKMAKVSTHVHETIELCVFVGRGKELIPLGVTSFVITGDEEEEVIHNTPVRLPRPGTSSFDRHFSSSKKRTRRRQKSGFANFPKESYELDDNAILQLGVRVLPQSMLRKASEREVEQREADERIFKEVLNELLGESFDEKSGKNLLVDQKETGGGSKDPDMIKSIDRKISLILPSGHDENSTEGTPKDGTKSGRSSGVLEEIISEDKAKTASELQMGAIANLFCGIDMCSRHSERSNQDLRVSTQALNVISSDAGKILSPEHTPVLPLSIVSSVSDSVGTKGSTPNHFYPSTTIFAAS